MKPVWAYHSSDKKTEAQKASLPLKTIYKQMKPVWAYYSSDKKTEAQKASLPLKNNIQTNETCMSLLLIW